VSVKPSLAHLPLPLLAIPMGTGGVGLAWREAAAALGAPAAIGEAILLLTALAWIVVVGLHGLRALRHTGAFLAELQHPVRVSFAAAPTIGLMILSAAAWPYHHGFGAALWGVAIPLHLVVAMLLLRRVLGGRGEAAMLAPPLLIPFVGNILAPAFGARMGFIDASWMMFGVGLVLWLAVLPLLLHRLFAGPPLPPPLKPALTIFLAPPAVGALALVALTGSTSGAVLMLAGVALLFAAVLLSLARELVAVPFGPAWWGLTFPTAAFAIMVVVLGFPPVMGWAALLLTTGITAYVGWRTALAARAGVFLRPEGH
jgi:tellurite resistance protein